MANVLERIFQRVDPDSTKEAAERGQNNQIYSNMMVYLKEMKLHNLKNLDLAEQIFTLSENSVEKLNEMKQTLAERLNEKQDSEELQGLLSKTDLLSEQVKGVSDLVRELNENQKQEEEQAENQKWYRELMLQLGQVQSQVEKMPKMAIDRDNLLQVQIKQALEGQEEVIKKESDAMKLKFEVALKRQQSEIATDADKSKRSVRLYLRFILWFQAAMLALIILRILGII